jgi:hypothetical protein
VPEAGGEQLAYTPVYRRHWRRWINDNGLGATASTKLRAGTRTHPGVIIKHMRAGTQPAARGPKAKPHFAEQDHRRNATRVHCYDGSRPPRPDQDLIRRVAHAMRSSGKNDWLQLATIAIETLTVEDLRDLMPKAMPAKFEMEFAGMSATVDVCYLSGAKQKLQCRSQKHAMKIWRQIADTIPSGSPLVVVEDDADAILLITCAIASVSTIIVVEHLKVTMPMERAPELAAAPHLHA